MATTIMGSDHVKIVLKKDDEGNEVPEVEVIKSFNSEREAYEACAPEPPAAEEEADTPPPAPVAEDPEPEPEPAADPED